MRSAITLFILLTTFIANAQNVGIGTTNPTELLDVNGNVNVRGTIKANGTDGAANQVLMKNSTGNLAWGDMGSYKNLATFTANGTWTVPAGVTKIVVEVWGAGGGGSSYAGGGGGGYITAVLTVTPATVVNFTIGTGGSGGNDNGNHGGYTALWGTGPTFFANGGYGSTSQSAVNVWNVPGGSFSASAGFTSYFGINGAEGKPNRTEFFQAGTSTWYESSSGGDGGDAGNSVNTGGRGTYRISTPGSSSTIRAHYNGQGNAPGGGGGAGFRDLASANNSNGNTGGNGLVVIRY